jgi:hypothetical protein
MNIFGAFCILLSLVSAAIIVHPDLVAAAAALLLVLFAGLNHCAMARIGSRWLDQAITALGDQLRRLCPSSKQQQQRSSSSCSTSSASSIVSKLT